MSDAMPEPTDPADPAATGDPAPDLADPEGGSTKPAFDVDLDPEDQGTAEAAAEPSG